MNFPQRGEIFVGELAAGGDGNRRGHVGRGMDRDSIRRKDLNWGAFWKVI